MRSKWVHYYNIKSNCPICGKPVHAALGTRRGKHYWVHDKFDMEEIIKTHEVSDNSFGLVNLCEIPREDFIELYKKSKESQ
jgi:hypothetical protein